MILKYFRSFENECLFRLFCIVTVSELRTLECNSITVLFGYKWCYIRGDKETVVAVSEFKSDWSLEFGMIDVALSVGNYRNYLDESGQFPALNLLINGSIGHHNEIVQLSFMNSPK